MEPTTDTIHKTCPICGGEMLYNSEFEAEAPSEEDRYIEQYTCKCGAEMTLSYPMTLEKREITINGSVLHLILNQTVDAWKSRFGGDGDELWDIDLDDFITGAVEVNEDIYYWYIDHRCYETSMEVTK